jgi:hypothetical protein
MTIGNEVKSVRCRALAPGIYARLDASKQTGHNHVVAYSEVCDR